MLEKDFVEKLRSALSKGLPGDEAHQNLAPIKRLSARNAIADKMNFKSSAVAIVLYPENQQIKCILIQRPAYDGIHGGQVSFPGGKVEPQDYSLEDTARRECYEEINLPTSEGELIGELSPVYIPVSNFMVQPFLFFVEKLPALKAEEREVESIIHFAVQDLLDENRQKTTSIQISKNLRQKNVPYFDIEDKVVWGATSMILAELKAVLKRI